MNNTYKKILEESTRSRLTHIEFLLQITTELSSGQMNVLFKISQQRQMYDHLIQFDYKSEGYTRQYYYKIRRLLINKNYLIKDIDNSRMLFINVIKYPCITVREINIMLKKNKPKMILP